MRKWLKIVLWSITSLIVVFAIFGFAFYKRFVVHPPEYDFSNPKNLAESQLQDIEYLSLYPDYDKSFDTEAKRDSFFLKLEALKRKLPAPKAVFEMEIAKALAYADNGHTNISSGARARRLNSVPLRFYWFKEGLFIILAMEGYEEFLGKRIVALNGIPPEDLLFKIKPWHGGTFEGLKAKSPLFFMSPEILYAIGLGSTHNSIQISIEDENKNILTRQIFASKEEKDVPGYWVPYWLHPYKLIKGTKWKSCKPEGLTSTSIKDMYQNVYHEFIGDVLYVQINDNYNTEERNIRSYLKGVTSQMREKQPKDVVFDLRFNPGGNNYHLPWPFIRSLNDYLTND
ncbi:MAG: hypothetical protein ACFB0A_04420 [Croceivirga sp.]